MKDFEAKRILVPTDLSDSSRIAIKYARLLAGRLSSSLTLLYADPILYPIDVMGVSSFYVGSTPEQLTSLETEVRAYAAAVLEGTDFDVVVVGGQPIPIILREARKQSADMIVMATHGLRGWRRTVLGSVTEGVLHGAECPVLSICTAEAVTPPSDAVVTKILCPVNFSDVARESLRCAARVAELFGAELVIAHVIEEKDAGQEAIDEQRVRRWIEPEIQDKCTFREIVLRGGAAERVLDCVEDIGADLLVIGAQHRMFRDATVIGTTTERLVRFAQCAVLTVTRQAEGAEKPETLN
ncbi:MAG TPA: universal stress protein [Thermoanaerobaculia bacterium]|nr:universal stress protein [Thermoanaerobaculia bacterium]